MKAVDDKNVEWHVHAAQQPAKDGYKPQIYWHFPGSQVYEQASSWMHHLVLEWDSKMAFTAWKGCDP